MGDDIPGDSPIEGPGHDSGTEAGCLGPGAFRTIVEASDDGVVTFDDDRRVRYVNPTVERFLRTDSDVLVGRTPREVSSRSPLPEDDARAVEAGIDEVLDQPEGSTPVERSFEFERADGDRRTVELQIARLPEDAEAGDVVATVRDVTGQHDVEAELRESRHKIEQLHRAATEIVACRTEEEATRRTVQAAEEILEFDVCVLTLKEGEWFVPVAVSSEMPDGGVRRYREDEGLLGKTHRTGESQRVDDVLADETADPADKAYRSGISVPIGEFGVFQATATETGGFDDDDVELAETLMAHLEETLRRIDTESQLRDRERELVTERDRFAALFENVPEPVVAFDFEDGDPIVIAVNGHFEEVFGYDAGEIVGESIDEYIVPEDRRPESDALNESLQAGERLQTTTQRRTVDGIRDFLLHVVPLEIGEQTLQGYAIYTDITDQKERQRELERQNERLDEFASIVSHDLRNPLSVAEGYLELASETHDPEHFEAIAEAHDRMRRMIDELLALAREGTVVGETGSVDLAEAAESAWKSARTDDAVLEVDCDRTVDADRERLIELLENLFRNAAEHADHSRVRVGTTDEGFYVADDGPGIAAEEHDRVFERGYTTADGGTGFGLAIVRQIAQAHDWSIEAGESDDGGARFDVDIGRGDH